MTNPQSWNGYAYVGNNPLNTIDPTGMHWGAPGQAGSPGYDASDSGGTADPYTSSCGGYLGCGKNRAEQAYQKRVEIGFYANLAAHYGNSGDIESARKIARLSGDAIQIEDVSSTFNGQKTHEFTTAQAAAAIGGTVAWVVAEPCGVGEMFLGAALLGSVLSDRMYPNSGITFANGLEETPLSCLALRDTETGKGTPGRRIAYIKDHWDVADKQGKKVKAVDFDSRQIWPGGPKNKNKQP